MPGARDVPSTPTAPGTGTALVAGVVVSADLDRPVRRAEVQLVPTTFPGPLVTTADEQGRFRFENVRAGRYTLTVSKPGYLDSTFGQRRPGSGRPGTPLSVAEGQRLERLTLPIARGGVLAGTVVDDGGEPAYGAEVRALKYVWQGGEQTLRPAGSARVDDRGGYRIGALPPGEYVLMVTPPGDAGVEFATAALIAQKSGSFDYQMVGGGLGMPARPAAIAGTDPPRPSSGYSPVYYPGTTAPGSALSLALGIGEVRSGLDVQLQWLPMGHIVGVVMGNAQPATGIEVRLVRLDQALPGLGAQSTVTGRGGRFSFLDVTPGRYQLRAHAGSRRTVIVDESAGEKRVMEFVTAPAPPPGGDGGGGIPMGLMPEGGEQWAEAEVTLSGLDTQNVTLTLQDGTTVSGRILFDGSGQPPPDLSALRVVLNSGGPSKSGFLSASSRIEDDGSFAIDDVVPGRYRVAVLSPGGWRPRSFDVLGRDALDFLLEVEPHRDVTGAVLTMTRQTASLSGTFYEASGQPGAAYTVVVFADNPAYWTPQSRRIQATRPATDGQFSFANLPAGRYRLVAVDDLEDGRWFDPEILGQLASSAMSVTLAEGERKTQDVRVTR